MPAAIATIGSMPRRGASGTKITAHAIVATLNIAGDSAGTKKRCSALSIAISTAATATIPRNGNIEPRQPDRQLELARDVAESRGVQVDERLGEQYPCEHDRAGDEEQQADDV